MATQIDLSAHPMTKTKYRNKDHSRLKSLGDYLGLENSRGHLGLKILEDRLGLKKSRRLLGTKKIRKIDED